MNIVGRKLMLVTIGTYRVNLFSGALVIIDISILCLVESQ